MCQHNIAQIWARAEGVLRATGTAESDVRLIRMGFYQGGFQLLAHHFMMIENGASVDEINANIQSSMNDCLAHFAHESYAGEIWARGAAALRAAGATTSDIRLAKMGFYQGGFAILAHYVMMIKSRVPAEEVDTNVRSIMTDCQVHFAYENDARPVAPLILALIQAGESSTSSM